MRSNTVLFLAILLAALFSIGATAEEFSGKTADGCSYKVINGVYMTSCPKKGEAQAQAAATDHVQQASAAPVTSYSDVPVRKNYGAAAPQLPPQQPSIQPSVSSSFEKSESAVDLDQFEDARRNKLRNKLIDQTYAGLTVGANNMKETNAGSATGVGLDIGTNIDDTFGVEIGYSYAKQSLNMGLASRGSNVDQSIDPSQQQPLMTPKANDASLSTHLFTGEMQAHLTDPLKRLRPYVGAGLGWRSATLNEEANNNTFTGQSLTGGSLHQSALGGLASAGTKLRVAKAVQLGFAFKYFFPLARQEARVEQPLTASNTPSKLSASDDSITGSSQYQVLGGVQYSF